MVRGSAEASSCSYQRLARSTIRCPASRNSLSRSAWVASIDPLPGSDRPSASVRQFIELAVNMPEQLPQDGQAERSIASPSSSLYCSSAAANMASTRSRATSCPFSTTLPASIGPPETKHAGTLRQNGARSQHGRYLCEVTKQTHAAAKL